MFLNDEEYVKRLGQLYEKVLSLRKDDDYVINQTQMDKFVQVMDFFLDMGNRSNGKVEPVKLVPKEENGGVTATFVVFDVYGDNIKRFCDAIQHCSSMTIDATSDSEICISVTVPNVFTHK